jgi:hypothetical protein
LTSQTQTITGAFVLDFFKNSFLKKNPFYN